MKGHGLPFAGHKDNHAGLMTTDQHEAPARRMGIIEGQEWEPFAGIDRSERAQLEALLAERAVQRRGRRRR